MGIVKTFLALLLSLSFLSLTACPGGSSSADLPSTADLNQKQLELYENTPKPLFVVWDQIRRMAPRFQFHCEDCPRSIGQMVAMQVDYRKAKPVRITTNCQGGLVGEGLFVTNRHCLPPDLLQKGKSCQNRIKIIFPKVDNESSIDLVDCHQVVDFSEAYTDDENDRQPDWALLSLRASLQHRLPKRVFSPLADSTEVFTFAPVEDPWTGNFSMQKLSCTSQQRTLFLPQYVHEESPLFLLRCDGLITKRFSGSMVFKETGEGLTPVATISHIWDRQINNESILVSDKVLAASLFCVPGVGPVSENCAFDPSRHLIMKEDIVVQAIQTQEEGIKGSLDPYLTDSHPVKWKVLSVEDIESQKTVPQYQEAWAELGSSPSDFITSRAQNQYFKSLVQITPVCIKKEYLPARGEASQTEVTMPVIDLKVSEDSNRQVKAEYEVRHWPTRIWADANRAGHFVFSPSKPLEPMQYPEHSILSQRQNHFLVSLPACP